MTSAFTAGIGHSQVVCHQGSIHSCFGHLHPVQGCIQDNVSRKGAQETIAQKRLGPDKIALAKGVNDGIILIGKPK